MSTRTPNKRQVFWFRQDLRLADNPALTAALDAGPVQAIYILDDTNAGDWKMGGASRVWLHHALKNLKASLDGNLSIYAGDPAKIIPALNPTAVYWNRCYEPWRINRDTRLKEQLQADSIEVQSFNGSLLWEPWEISKQDGTPYKVFTPFYRKGCLAAFPPREPLGPAVGRLLPDEGVPLESLDLLDTERDWPDTIASGWDISEAGGQARLETFLESGLEGYKQGRDVPSGDNISRLSSYLHFGQISPNQAWYRARFHGDKNALDTDTDHFCSELAWREFSYSLLYYQPDLPAKNLQAKFDGFPWATDAVALRRWQKGQTGIPIVDAGMRELWQTGYMHNRVRMVVASFLVKNLLIDWREGEKWFWDCLFDADLANNAASWQWVAGCGADAAPYFRIFNPVLQGEKFDANGDYVRAYVPEFSDIEDKFIHSPWKLPHPPVAYPAPIVDLKGSRERALSAYKSLA